MCGSQWCIQTDLSIYGFAEKYTGKSTQPGDFSGWIEFIQAFDEGDAKAVQVAEENAEILAGGISIVVNLLDPEQVVLGGIPKNLFQYMQETILRVNRARRVVQGAPDTTMLMDENCIQTVIEGAAEMGYARWVPEV